MILTCGCEFKIGRISEMEIEENEKEYKTCAKQMAEDKNDTVEAFKKN